MSIIAHCTAATVMKNSINIILFPNCQRFNVCCHSDCTVHTVSQNIHFLDSNAAIELKLERWSTTNYYKSGLELSILSKMTISTNSILYINIYKYRANKEHYGKSLHCTMQH